MKVASVASRKVGALADLRYAQRKRKIWRALSFTIRSRGRAALDPRMDPPTSPESWLELRRVLLHANMGK